MTSIRANWSHVVASALQLVVGEMLDVDADTIVEPFRRLADRTPPPANVAERRELKARLVEFSLRLGTDFHTWFHRRDTTCACLFQPIESAARIWFDSRTAESREPRAESREPRAESREPRGTLDVHGRRVKTPR